MCADSISDGEEMEKEFLMQKHRKPFDRVSLFRLLNFFTVGKMINVGGA